MKPIKFSHNYWKLLDLNIKDEDQVKLRQILKVNYSDLHEAFIEYDARYEGGKYELPKTDLIILIFSKELDYKDTFIFTTIRRYTKEKWDYYKKSEGEIFKISIGK